MMKSRDQLVDLDHNDNPIWNLLQSYGLSRTFSTARSNNQTMNKRIIADFQTNLGDQARY